MFSRAEEIKLVTKVISVPTKSNNKEKCQHLERIDEKQIQIGDSLPESDKIRLFELIKKI